MKNKNTFRLVFCGLFAALTAGLTVFPKVPIPVGGYVHLGDVMIYLCASILPAPFALCAAVIGASLADIISGFAIYLPFTGLAKALLAICFTNKSKKFLAKRNYFAPLGGIIITVLVYFCADLIYYGSAGATAGILWNFLQGAVTAVIYYISAASFDKTELKNKLRNFYE